MASKSLDELTSAAVPDLDGTMITTRVQLAIVANILDVLRESAR